MINRQVFRRSVWSAIITGFMAFVILGRHWTSYYNFSYAFCGVLLYAGAGFLAALAVQFTLAYSHVGWRRLAIVSSPLFGLIMFVGLLDSAYDDSSDHVGIIIFSLFSFALGGAALLLAKDIVLWVAAGFGASPAVTATVDDRKEQRSNLQKESPSPAPQSQKVADKPGDIFSGLRAGLIEAYKPKPVEGATCVTCGATNAPVSLHMLEFNQPEAMPVSTLLVPMSKSYGTLRGSVPICTACAPTCDQCGLPISTPWVARIGQALQLKIKGIKIERGNGVCRHIHPILDLLSLTKKVSLFSGE